jgi:3-hydroxyisobutyrate dehydrogenase-like beta-hydroxyacid dehydrogenase
MSQQVAARLSGAEVATLDAAVAAGAAPTRSAALRLAIAHLGRQQRYDQERAVLAAHAEAGLELYPDLVGLELRA